MTPHDHLAVATFVPSFAQERLWFMEQLIPGTAAYVIVTTVRLRGPLDYGLLQAALDAVARRHDSVRTRFPRTADGRPIAEIAGEVSVPMRVISVAGEPEARKALSRAAATPFDLTVAPLLRATLIRHADDNHLLQLAMHHVVSDGWSMSLLLGEIRSAYGGQALPEAAVSYRDYADSQRATIRSESDSGLGFWTEALSGVPPLELPTDRPRPPEQRFEAGLHRFEIDAALAAQLRQLGRQMRATPYMILLAGLQAVLHRYTGQRDFAIGSPVAGRPVPELEKVVGLFVNTLALRADLSLEEGAEPSFAVLLKRTRSRALRAMAHQDTPFERVVQELNMVREMSRTPVFQVMFAMQNYARSTTAWPHGLVEESISSELSTTRFDLSLYVSENTDGGFRAVLLYSASLFDAATAQRLAGHYVTLLAAAAAAPHTPVAELELLDPAETAEVLGFGAPEAESPTTKDGGAAVRRARTLGGLITSFAQATPQAAAVVCGASTLTYGELERRSNSLARFLRERGVGPDKLVGVCLEQSTDLAVALLAVLKAGGAYVPLDPEQPPARLGAMVADAGLALALTTTGLRHHLQAAGLAEPVCLDLAGARIAEYPATPLPELAEPDDLAYVIYTSGSTGAPKGVAVPHRPVLNYLDGVADRFRITPAARYVLLQSMSFDFSVTVFYLSLATGGTVHLVPRRCSGAELAEYLRLHRIDYYKITPSHFVALAADAGAEALLPRRALIFGGEAANLRWAAELAAAGRAEVFNHYGPTETTVGATTYHVSAADNMPGMVPIGRPLPHTRIYVLDGAGRPAPIGVPGEIHIGGERLARGYLGRADLTGEKFVPDPFSGRPGARMYSTGDLGRWRPDGNLEFLGRRDHQIKIRGYRVELGEVETALAACPGVVQAVAMMHGDRLVGYLETEPGAQPLEPGQVRAALADRLPDYMIPNRFVWLDRLPLQDHGKVDRKALPAPADDRVGAEYAEPQGPLERAIAEIWQRLLEVERVGATDDFFDLGGHSLLATQVVAVLRRELPDSRPVSVVDLFKLRTVRGLAEVAAGTSTAAAGGLLHELTPASATIRRTLLCVPYGGGSAVVYQPLADALPAGDRLLSVAMPGHDIGVGGDPVPLPEVARAVAAEVLSTVDGPLAIYGHCGPGGAVAVEIARLLEAAGREVECVYLGAVFPFARPVGGLLGPLARLRIAERFRSDHLYRTWLQAQGADLGTLDAAQSAFIIRAMRHDARASEDYFTDLLHRKVTPLRAPIVSVVGERDRSTEYHQERYQEWQFLSGHTELRVIEEGGHYFLKYRAGELAGIVAETPAPRQHAEVAAPADEPSPKPSMTRFLTVASGQIVSTTGSSLTTFALPLSVYLETGSLTRLALFAILGIVPGLLIAPVAGAVIDRSSRRRMLILANCAAAVPVFAMAAILISGLGSGWHFYVLVGWLSMAAMWQRLAFLSAAPQLVPKRYLGHANGLVQMSTGLTQFLVPLAAVAMLAAVGMRGILILDVVSYVVALVVLLGTKFPRTMALRRRESIGAEIAGGARFSFRRREFRAMLAFFAGLNLFLFPLLYLISPLVLGFASLNDVATVAITGGLGGAAGGVIMLVWGGPRRARMRGVLLATFGIAAGAVVIGSRPDLRVIAIGVFALYCSLAVVNGIYTTIVHTKVPQRYHGRVFALNQMVAFSTLPLGWGLLAPTLSRLAEPLLMPGGALAPTVGHLIGVGAGRGIALVYLVFGLCVALTAAVSLLTPVLAGFDRQVADAQPDDVVGLQALRESAGRADRHAETKP